MPSKTVLFTSTLAKEHRLVMDQKDYIWKGPRVQGETPGHTIEFQNGVYRTDDPSEIEFLRAKQEYDGAVMEIPEQVPDPSPVLAELATASTERTEEILREEHEGWMREIVIRTCEAKLGGEPYSPPIPEGEDPDAPFGRKADGTARLRRVPAHIAEKMK